MCQIEKTEHNEYFSSQWQLATATILPVDSNKRRIYFFSENLPDAARNIHHVYASVEKQEIIFGDDAPWEQGCSISSFCGTILRLDNGNYRLYYTTIDAQEMRIAVAESMDGIHWSHTPLGQEMRQGFDTNRIVFTGVPENQAGETGNGEIVTPDGMKIAGSKQLNRQGHVCQPQVVRLPDGRWRMYYWHHQHGWGEGPEKYTIAESVDGLKWHVPDYDRPALNSHFLRDQSNYTEEKKIAQKSRRTNDANYVYYNPYQRCYEQFSQWFLDAIPERRIAEDNCPDLSRMIQRRTSADGIKWTAPELVIVADSQDPWDQQFYHLAIQYHEDWLIGSLGHFRAENSQQTMDLELVFSQDGRKWERPIRGGFIPRDPGGFDSEGIYPSNAWIDQGDRWLCLYNPTARKHNQHAGPDVMPSRIMAATWPKHRFVGLRADSVPGSFLTPIIFPQSSEIKIDANVRGWLRAELCDAWGRKREGYHLENSILVQGDNSAHTLSWGGHDAGAFLHDPVRLRFEFVNADIYSVAF
jgi:hypothetical protein